MNDDLGAVDTITPKKGHRDDILGSEGSHACQLESVIGTEGLKTIETLDVRDR